MNKNHCYCNFCGQPMIGHIKFIVDHFFYEHDLRQINYILSAFWVIEYVRFTIE